MITDPTGVSGCFWWLAADNLSLNDGDNVTSWTDLSGSGNTVTSTGFTPPIYKTFQVNGRPSVRFDCETDSLKALSKFHSGPPVHMTEGTWFVVYKRNDMSARGAGLIDCSSVINNNTQWALCIDQNSDMSAASPSGWLFLVNDDDLGRTSHFAKGYVESSSIAGSGWLLRSERSEGPWHSFFLNGSVLGSSDATGTGGSPTLQINSTYGGNLTVGTALEIRADNGNYFTNIKADIAEIACYSRALSDDEMSDVHTYLLNKYFNGAFNSCDLYISGGNTSHTAQSGVDLYTSAASGINSSMNLYVSAATNISSGVPLYTASSGMSAHNIFPLYISSSVSQSGSMDLYTQSANTWGNSIHLYVPNIGSGTSSTTLYTHALNHINNQFDMVGSGHGHIEDYRFLFTKGYAAPHIDKKADLFTFAAMPPAQTIYSTANLYTRGVSAYASMNLVTGGSGEPTSGTASHGTTMFLKTRELINPAAGTTELFVKNSVEEIFKSAKLYIKGEGLLDGGSVARASMPLYINRVPCNTFDMYVCGASVASSGIDLSIHGGSINNFPLYVHGGIGSASGVVELYVPGPSGINNSVDMFVAGYPQLQKQLPLYVRGL